MEETDKYEGFRDEAKLPGKKKKWPFILTACALAVMLFVGGFLFRGWIEPPQTDAPTASHSQQIGTQFSLTITGEPEGDRLVRIGFIQYDLIESDRSKANTVSMQDTFNTSRGYELIVADGQNDHDRQLQIIAGFIQQDADYIVIAPVQETGWDAVLQQAKGADIPVIFIDRTVNASDDLYVTWIGSDYKEQGVKAMEWLKSFRGSTPVKAVHLQGTQGSLAQVGRSAAYTEACAINGWENLAEMAVSGGFTQAKEITADWLARFPDINVVITEDDDMTDGVIMAIEEAGMKAGGDDGITVISFSASRKSLQFALDTSKINCIVECNPLHGIYVADVIQKLQGDDSIPKSIYVEDTMFDWRDLSQTAVDARAY